MFTQILLIALIAALLFKGPTILRGLQEQRRRSHAERNRQPARRAKASPPARDDEPLDMLPCPRCGAYVAAGERCSSCGHEVS